VIAPPRSGSLVVTIDTIVEGVDFDLASTRAASVGHKALACNLSDIAAMGCRPVAATISVAAPPRVTQEVLRRVFRGMSRLADRFGVDLVGGDYSASPRDFVISVALYGETAGLRPLRRSGARVGDAILVTGALGGSILGRHLRFTPRVEEGLLLNRHYRIRSMIDVSDGLSIDLHRLSRASGVGAVIDADRIPISGAARRLARTTGRTALEHALGDGEDFELLFTAAPREAERIVGDGRLRVPVSIIGRVTRRGCLLRDDAGRERPLAPAGWEHELRAD